MKFISKIPEKKLYLLMFLFVFIITFVVTYVFMPLNYDEVWSYGFSYNISKGLIIYRDFNVVTTPLYYFISLIFIKIFGNYIISTQIFNSIISALMFLMMFKVIKWKVVIVFITIIFCCPNGYTLLALFWLMLLLYLIDQNKDNDILIAFIIGLCFMSKQNIGFVLLIPYLFYSKNKIKGIITFLIPFLVISIYLLLNNAFYEFIDYCFLGLFDFGSNNYTSLFCVFEIFILIYLVYNLIKSKFIDREVFYILMFQIVMYPIADDRHFFTAFFPVMYYILKNVKFFQVWYTIFLVLVFFNIPILKNIIYNHDVSMGKNFLFLKVCWDIPNVMEKLNAYLEDVDNYYIIDYYAYIYKLYYDIPIGNYDLWNEGNMGYNGINERINEVDEICNNNECIFIVNCDLEGNSNTQLNKMYNYVVDNYYLIDKIEYFYIYSNGEKKDNF